MVIGYDMLGLHTLNPNDAHISCIPSHESCRGTCNTTYHIMGKHHNQLRITSHSSSIACARYNPIDYKHISHIHWASLLVHQSFCADMMTHKQQQRNIVLDERNNKKAMSISICNDHILSQNPVVTEQLYRFDIRCQ